MNSLSYHLMMVYLFGLTVGVTMFYLGSVRGGSKHHPLWSLLFGAVWFITIPLVIISAIKKINEENRK